MIGFIRTRFKLVCLICFVLTSGAGILALMKPGAVYIMTGTPLEIFSESMFFFQFGFLLVALVGVWFLIIMINPDKNRPLLILACAEKFVFVAYIGWALWTDTVSLMTLPILFGDLLMGLACLIYLVMGSGQSTADA